MNKHVVGGELLSKAAIAARIEELGNEISTEYGSSSAESPLLLVVVLKGASIFAADLMRQISVPLEVDFLAVSSYGAATKSTGVVRIVKDLENEVTARDVLIVEDIIDTGLTLSYLKDHLNSQNPASVKCVSLLTRQSRGTDAESVDYVGFEIADDFVVGYGLDYAQLYRNLPNVRHLELD